MLEYYGLNFESISLLGDYGIVINTACDNVKFVAQYCPFGLVVSGTKGMWV